MVAFVQASAIGASIFIISTGLLGELLAMHYVAIL